MKPGYWAFGVFVSVAGCSASMEHKIDDARVNDIKACVTTEKELLAWFGKPSQHGNQNGLPPFDGYPPTTQWEGSYSRHEFQLSSIRTRQPILHARFFAGK